MIAPSGRSILAVVPALVAALALQHDVPYIALVLDGGWSVLLSNLAKVVVALYLPVCLVGLGCLIVPTGPTGPADPRDSAGVGEIDLLLLQFMAGAAGLTLLGFALAATSLLVPLVTLPLFLLLCLNGLRNSARHAVAPWLWLSAADLAPVGSWVGKASCYVIRWSLPVVVLLILLNKAVLIDLHSSDSMQLYFPYFEEVRSQGGFWLAADKPFTVQNLVARGNGVYLFFTNFTDAFFIQYVSAVYFLAVMVLLRRTLQILLPPLAALQGSNWRLAVGLAPDCVILLILTYPPLLGEFGKVHEQMAFLLLAFGWCGLLLGSSSRSAGRKAAIAMSAIALAIPLIFPEFAAAAAPIGLVVVLMLLFARRWDGLLLMLPVALAGTASLAFTLTFNYLTLGIPAMNLAHYFVPYADPARLALWTSRDIIDYVNLTQHLGFETLYPTEVDISPLARGFRHLLAHYVINYRATLVALVVCAVVMAQLARARWHLLVVLAVAALLTAMIHDTGLILLGARDIVAEFGQQALVPHGPIRMLINQGLLFLMLSCLAYLLYMSLPLAAMIAPSIHFRWPGAMPFERRQYACAIGLAGLILALFLLVSLVPNPSLIRALRFRQALQPVLGAFALIWILIYIERAIGFYGPERFSKRWVGVAALVAGILAALLVPRSAHRQYDLPYHNGDVLALAAVPFVLGVCLAFVMPRRADGLRRMAKQITDYLGSDVSRLPGICVFVFFAMLAVANLTPRWQIGRPFHPETISRSLDFALGRAGATVGMPDRQVGVRRCLELAGLVPPGSRIMALNGLNAVVPCLNSPLVPRNLVVHHYESNLAPRFAELLYRNFETASAIYRSKGVDYFLVLRDNDDYWGPAYGATFDEESLLRHFDVAADSGSFVLLTWRGGGERPVDPDLARALTEQRDSTRREEQGSWYAFEALRQLLEDEGRFQADPEAPARKDGGTGGGAN